MSAPEIPKKESGRFDWLLERGTALLLLGLVPWLGVHLAFLPGLSRIHLEEWLHRPINALTMAFLIGIAAVHASLGLRSILMDYIASPSLRSLNLFLVRATLVVSAVVGMGALWTLARPGT